jgi:Holliday junction resolvase-like predicted endonuclease
VNRAAKGRRNEHRSMALFERAGYRCIRSAASKGEWDFVAISDRGIVLVQVKTSRWASSREMEAMRAFPCPKGCVKVVHRWLPRRREPDVRYVR